MLRRHSEQEPQAEETQAGELELKGPAGVGVRYKGYRLMDIAWVIVGGGVIWGAWELKAHAGDSEKQSAAIVKSINDANAAMVQSLKESTQSLRESNAHTVKALQDLTAEQRRATNAIREVACLNDPALKNNPNASAICKRLVGNERSGGPQ
jgi:hypothetical protein